MHPEERLVVDEVCEPGADDGSHKFLSTMEAAGERADDVAVVAAVGFSMRGIRHAKNVAKVLDDRVLKRGL
jgi:hypothetical protein